MPQINVNGPLQRFNTKIKEYPHLKKISVFNRQIFNPMKIKLPDDDFLFTVNSFLAYSTDYEYILVNDENSDFAGYWIKKRVIPSSYNTSDPRGDSIKRSLDKAFDIALSNNFKYFITLTLDEEKISRTDTTEINKKLKTWLSNMVRRNDFNYIIFPEFHKRIESDGSYAIHFHGLCNGVFDTSPTGLYSDYGKEIFSLNNWKFGYSSVFELSSGEDDNLKIVRYVMKYISKGCTKIFGKFYFAGGKSLIRNYPATFENVDFSSFDGELYDIPSAGTAVKYKTEVLLDV